MAKKKKKELTLFEACKALIEAAGPYAFEPYSDDSYQYIDKELNQIKRIVDDIEKRGNIEGE